MKIGDILEQASVCLESPGINARFVLVAWRLLLLSTFLENWYILASSSELVALQRMCFQHVGMHIGLASSSLEYYSCNSQKIRVWLRFSMSTGHWMHVFDLHIVHSCCEGHSTWQAAGSRLRVICALLETSRTIYKYNFLVCGFQTKS